MLFQFQACASWLDSDEDAKAFKASEDKLSRAFLLSSQMIVNLAMSDAATRVRRQVSLLKKLPLSKFISWVYFSRFLSLFTKTRTVLELFVFSLKMLKCKINFLFSSDCFIIKMLDWLNP